MGGKDRQPEADEPRVSGISRRKFIAGGLIFVGGSSLLGDSGTLASFRDNVTAGGSIRVDGEPTLNYRISDAAKNDGKAAFDIFYQVEWVTDFDRIEIRLDDDSNEEYQPGQKASDSFTEFSSQGKVSSGPYGGNHGGKQFEFFFEVYESNNSTPVIERRVTKTAGSGSKGDGDFGNANSPELDWAMVEDVPNNSGAEYSLYYGVSKTEDFGQVRVTFENRDKSTATKTNTIQASPTGKTAYSKGGTDQHEYDIIVEVENQDGLVVDSQTINDTADWTDPPTYGDPVRKDSPRLDSFTVYDTNGGKTDYEIEYSVTNTERFAGVDVIIDNLSDDGVPPVRSDHTEPYESVSYSQGGTSGDTFDITVQVLETRDGVTFPIDSGTIQDVSTTGGSQTWPEDA